MRQPISVTSTYVPQIESHREGYYLITALCNDGSIWLYGEGAHAWTPLPTIPQLPKKESNEPL